MPDQNTEPEIHVIPPEFYGSASKAHIPKFREGVAAPQPTAVPAAPQAMTKPGVIEKPQPRASRAWLWLLLGVIFIALAVVMVLLLLPKREPPRPVVSLPPQPVGQPEAPPPPPEPPAQAEPLPPVAPTPAPPPAKPLQNSSDADADGITDEEEILYRTDSQRPDTDADGFLDGNEVYHLYSPIATRPTTLRESGLVQPYINPVYPYTIYTPSLWETRSLNNRHRAVTFTAATGEFVEVSVEENGSGLPIREWYRSRAPEVDQNAIMDFKTKGGYAGVWSPDRLSAFIPSGTVVYVISYNVGSRAEINFRLTFEMMLNALRITGIAPIFPEEPPLPSPEEVFPTSTEPFAEPEEEATSTVISNP